METVIEEQDKIAKVAELLKSAKSILFITGAGISVDSGLPTYRGIGGLYEDKDTEDGIPVEMALAGHMLKANPAVTWKYIAQIERNCRNATFNRAHEVIAEMERHFERVWVLTQNVDGFHRAAGSKNVIDIHGDIHQILCTQCSWQDTVKDFSGLAIPPSCPECSALVRPNVVFFGEELPQEKFRLLQKEEISRGFDIYFSIGTTSVFPYIKGPIVHARALGKPTIEINPTKTAVSDIIDTKLSLGAAEALERTWREHEENRGD